MKYVIVQAPDGEAPVLFPRSFQHRYVAALLRPMSVVSAGFVAVEDGTPRCYGASVGLSLRARPRRDSAIVAAALSDGVSSE